MRDLMLVRLAAVDEQQLVAGIETSLERVDIGF